MPGLDEQVRVLPVTDHAPPCRKDLLDLVGPKKHVGDIARHPVHGRTERIQRAELVHHMTGCRIDAHGLGASQNRVRENHAESNDEG